MLYILKYWPMYGFYLTHFNFNNYNFLFKCEDKCGM